MKKITLSFIAIACSAIVFAQNYDEVKNMLLIRNYVKAKELLDKNWSNAKFVSKPDAYILKAAVYAGLSLDSANAAQAPKLREEAQAALDKYREMDPKMTMLLDKDSYTSGAPIGLYSGYFNEGISNYNKKKWPESYEAFKKAVQMSDLLTEYKIADIALDTNGILLAGASAQNMKNNDEEAVKYFKRLADIKVGGDENEFFYQFLTNYYLQKGDMANFNKYLGLGKEVFPKSKYFEYDDIDFILNMEDEAKKMKMIDDRLAADPNNYKIQAAYGEMLFGRLNPKDTSTALPANYDEIETKMVAAFTKASELKPENGLFMTNLANHYINKSIKTNKQLTEHQEVMREKAKAAKAALPPAKPGTKQVAPAPEKADLAKKEALLKEYETNVDQAASYYEKAIAIYSKLTSPTAIEKQQYRNAVSYLIDINREKKENSRGKVADYDKYEKAEKKWTELYSKL